MYVTNQGRMRVAEGFDRPQSPQLKRKMEVTRYFLRWGKHNTLSHHICLLSVELAENQPRVHLRLDVAAGWSRVE